MPINMMNMHSTGTTEQHGGQPGRDEPLHRIDAHGAQLRPTSSRMLRAPMSVATADPACHRQAATAATMGSRPAG